MAAPLTQSMGSIDDLLSAGWMDVKGDQTEKNIADEFRAMADAKIISPQVWEGSTFIKKLPFLLQSTPKFPIFDFHDISTHAALVVTSQPGMIHVPSSNSTLESFRVELVPHPCMPFGGLKSWRVGNLQVQATVDDEVGPKRKVRKGAKSSAVSDIKINRQYQFNFMDVLINDLKMSPTGMRPVVIKFSCVAMDPMNRSMEFTAYANPFGVFTNCNQWHFGMDICLRHHIFGKNCEQASFTRVFNYVQLAYLSTKGFAQDRFLQPEEITSWIFESVKDDHLLSRDLALFHSHDIVTKDLYSAWFESAGAIFYDLHTSNVGKKFQYLWATGYIGIGGSYRQEEMNDPEGHYRMVICCERDIPSTKSYLSLENSSSSHPLIPLERDNIGYFFEHSRNSIGCTHLVSFTEGGDPLPVEDLYDVRKKL